MKDRVLDGGAEVENPQRPDSEFSFQGCHTDVHALRYYMNCMPQRFLLPLLHLCEMHQ